MRIFITDKKERRQNGTLTHSIFFFILNWAYQIRTDEMQESKSCALPLGEGPIGTKYLLV